MNSHLRAQARKRRKLRLAPVFDEMLGGHYQMGMVGIQIRSAKDWRTYGDEEAEDWTDRAGPLDEMELERELAAQAEMVLLLHDPRSCLSYVVYLTPEKVKQIREMAPVKSKIQIHQEKWEAEVNAKSRAVHEVNSEET